MKNLILISFILLFCSAANAQTTTDTLNPVQDAHLVFMGPLGNGYCPVLKFDISSIPAGRSINSVVLEVYVGGGVGASWNGDVMFMNMNDQAWNETTAVNSVWGITRSDTIYQSSGFGDIFAAWTSSIDIKQIFNKDYDLGNTYCSIMLHDPDNLNNFPVMLNNSMTDIFIGTNMAYRSFRPREFSNQQLIPRLIINYDTVTGNEEHKENAFTIYPNPFTDILSIVNSTNTPSIIEIVNSMGQSVKKMNFTGFVSFSTDELPQGIYFVKIETEGDVSYKKVVKN